MQEEFTSVLSPIRKSIHNLADAYICKDHSETNEHFFTFADICQSTLYSGVHRVNHFDLHNGDAHPGLHSLSWFYTQSGTLKLLLSHSTTFLYSSFSLLCL